METLSKRTYYLWILKTKLNMQLMTITLIRGEKY